jgi:hypothetical protein
MPLIITSYRSGLLVSLFTLISFAANKFASGPGLSGLFLQKLAQVSLFLAIFCAIACLVPALIHYIRIWENDRKVDAEMRKYLGSVETFRKPSA